MSAFYNIVAGPESSSPQDDSSALNAYVRMEVTAIAATVLGSLLVL